MEEPLFVEELSNFFKCPICQYCLKDATQTSCGHRFCRDCIGTVLQSSQPLCPIDRHVLDNGTVFPDAACRRQINSLRVYCRAGRDTGCEWSGDLSDETLHQNTCGYATAPCPACAAIVQRVDMAEHEKRECPKRQVKCEHCSEDMEHQEMPSHLLSCPEFPILCPIKCSKEPFPRKQLESHETNVCPRTKLPCQLALFGCPLQLERQKMAEHLGPCALEHVGQMAGVVAQQDTEIARLQNELCKQRSLVDHLISSRQYPSSGKFVWKLEEISSKLKMKSKEEIYSPEFYSHEGGYKMCLCVYPNGDSDNRALSLYFVLMQGPHDAWLRWPFNCKVVLTLMNAFDPTKSIKKLIQPDPRLSYFQKPTSSKNAGYGYPSFITHSKLLEEESGFVDNNSILLCSDIEI